MQRLRGSMCVVLLLAAAGCATLSRPELQGPAAQCFALFEQVDAQARAAGVGDASLYRVPGFPYLRATRFLASFAGEVDDEPRFGAWIAEMRAEDQSARDEEILATAGIPGWAGAEAELRERLAACGERLVLEDLASPRRRAALRDAVQVPSDYSVAQRLFGFYPAAALFLKLGIRGYHKDVAADFAQPLQPPAGARLVLWQPQDTAVEAASAPEIAGWMARAAEHPLGIPQFQFDEIERLMAAHAPAWWIEEAGAADRPGSPVPGTPPTVDAAQVQTYMLLEFARFGGKVLPQLVYVVWFPERPPDDGFDPYAGRLDGLVWRVTLGTDGEPLVYDTIHACGCYHQYFPARVLQARPQDGFWLEPVLMPQGVAPPAPLALRIASGTHYLRRVVPLAEAEAAERTPYTLVPYGELTFVPDEERRPRSLFDPVSGIVRGSERLERFWLWVSGVRSPGAMRAWGRHATAFVGTRHFDEPFLLDALFLAPERF